jgi:hypothetical protein
MPILKVSEALQPKQGYSGMRIPVISQPIDNCPQCGSGGYRDGICANAACNYLDPRLEAAYEEYAIATQVQNAAMTDAANDAMGGAPDQKKDTKKKASADGQTPSAIIDQFSPNSEKVKKEKCKVCGNTSIVDGTCTTQACYGSLPPQPFRTPSAPATGINWKRFKIDGPDKVPLKIPRTFEVLNSGKKNKTTKSKKKVQATINRLSAKQKEQAQVSPGMFLDSQMILPKQPVVRMQQALQLDATMQAEGALNSAGENNDSDKKTSEELQ